MRPAPVPAPTLPELRAQLQASLHTYPELCRGCRHLLADIDRVLGVAPAQPAPPRSPAHARPALASPPTIEPGPARVSRAEVCAR